MRQRGECRACAPVSAGCLALFWYAFQRGPCPGLAQRPNSRGEARQDDESSEPMLTRMLTLYGFYELYSQYSAGFSCFGATCRALAGIIVHIHNDP